MEEKIIQLNDTTYSIPSKENEFDTVIGDEKQEQFYPRVKIKRWDNECNFSVGVLDPEIQLGAVSTDSATGMVTWEKTGVKARFYPVETKDPVTPTQLRWIKMSTLSPIRAAAEYEMFRQLGHDTFAIATYRSSDPALMLFGSLPAEKHITLLENGNAKWYSHTVKTDTEWNQDIPVVRIPSPNANPYYMDDQLINVDIHFGELNVGDIDANWRQAVRTIVEKHGVETFVLPEGDISDRHNKIFFEDDNGDWVKFHSAEHANGILAGYVNIDCEYNRAYDYYRPDIEKDIRNVRAYGLKKKNPLIDVSIIDEIIVEFASLMGVELIEQPYSKEEEQRLDYIESLHTAQDWLSQGMRKDAGWIYWPRHNGFEFDVTFTDPVQQNIIPLSLQVKNVEFIYQAPLTLEEKMRGDVRPPHVEGSYAVYHTDPTKYGNEKYRTGKVFHIYRPMIEDANGLKYFCDLSIDAENSMMYITIPQEFLDVAVYPVILDPTFGYTSVGASTDNIVTAAGTVIVGGVFTGVNAIVDSITAYLDTAGSTTVQYQGLIYKNSDGSFINYAAEQTTLSAASWRTMAVSGGQVRAIDYILGVWATGTGTYGAVVNMYYDTGSGTGKTSRVVTYTTNSPPSSVAFSTNASRIYSIYATYTTVTVHLDEYVNGYGVRVYPQ